jgi:hypothetical protein
MGEENKPYIQNQRRQASYNQSNAADAQSDGKDLLQHGAEEDLVA